MKLEFVPAAALRSYNIYEFDNHRETSVCMQNLMRVKRLVFLGNCVSGFK